MIWTKRSLRLIRCTFKSSPSPLQVQPPGTAPSAVDQILVNAYAPVEPPTPLTTLVGSGVDKLEMSINLGLFGGTTPKEFVMLCPKIPWVKGRAEETLFPISRPGSIKNTRRSPLTLFVTLFSSKPNCAPTAAAHPVWLGIVFV